MLITADKILINAYKKRARVYQGRIYTGDVRRCLKYSCANYYSLNVKGIIEFFVWFCYNISVLGKVILILYRINARYIANDMDLKFLPGRHK